MVERRTKWMKPPLADHVWTDKEVDDYYVWKKQVDLEILTKGKEERKKHGGGVIKAEFEIVYDNVSNI